MQPEINITFRCIRKKAYRFLLSFWISFLFLATVNVEVQLRELQESYCNLSQTLSGSLMSWFTRHSYTLSLTVIISSVAFIIIGIHTNGKKRASQVILLFIHIFLTMTVETTLLIYPSYELWGNVNITLANSILIVLWRLSTPQVSLAGVKLMFAIIYILPITSSFLVQQRQLAFSEIFYRLFIVIWLYYAMLHFIAAHSIQSSSLLQISTQNNSNGFITEQNQRMKYTIAEQKISLNTFDNSFPNNQPISENLNKDMHDSNLNITTNPCLLNEIPFAQFSKVQNKQTWFNDSIFEVKEEQSSESHGSSPTQLKLKLKSQRSDKNLNDLDAISEQPEADCVKKFLPIQQVHDQQKSTILVISQDFNVCASSCGFQEAKYFLAQFQADFIDNYFQQVLKKGDAEQTIFSDFEQRKIMPLFKRDDYCQEMITFEVNQNDKLIQRYSDGLFNRQYKIAHLQDYTGINDTQLLIICSMRAQKKQNASQQDISGENGQDKYLKESPYQSNTQLHESSTFSTLAEAEKQFKTYKKRILACLSHELCTPINSIYFSLRSVMDEIELPQQVKELLFLGFKNTELLRIILNTLIDYSQMDIEECEINFSTFSLDNLLQNCVDIYSGVCEVKKLSISYDFDPKYPTSINSDQERLMQIIVNLLSYCVRQTSYGSIQISLQKDQNLIQCQTPIFISDAADYQEQQVHSGSASEDHQSLHSKNRPNEISSNTSESIKQNSQIQITVTVRGGLAGAEQLRTLKKAIAQGVASQKNYAAKGRRNKSMRQSEEFLTEKERALPLSPIFCAEMCKCLGNGQPLEVDSDGTSFMQFRFTIANQLSASSGLKQIQGTNSELRFEPILIRQMGSLHYSSGESDFFSIISHNKNNEQEKQSNRLLQQNDSKIDSKVSVFEQASQVKKLKFKHQYSNQTHTQNHLNNIQNTKQVKKHNSLLDEKQLQQMYQKDDPPLGNLDVDNASKAHNVSEYFVSSNISNLLPQKSNTLQINGKQLTTNNENSQSYYKEQETICENPKEFNDKQNLAIGEQFQQKQNSSFLAAILADNQRQQNNLGSLVSFNDFRNLVYAQNLALRGQICPQNVLQNKSSSQQSSQKLVKSAQELNQGQNDYLKVSPKKKSVITKNESNTNVFSILSNKCLRYQHASSAPTHNCINNEQERQFSFENIMLQESMPPITTENQESIQRKMESLNKQTEIYNNRQKFLNSPSQRNNISSQK